MMNTADDENAGRSNAVLDDDDFFGDQTSEHLEQERQAREVEVLRRQHLTTGIREGASSSRDAHLQRGFDSGFAAGAKAAAEPGFLLGACSFLEAFFERSISSRGSSRSQAVDDTEVPVQDISDVKRAATQLRQSLRDLPEGTTITVSSAIEACQRVAVLEVPSTIVNPNPLQEQNESLN